MDSRAILRMDMGLKVGAILYLEQVPIWDPSLRRQAVARASQARAQPGCFYKLGDPLLSVFFVRALLF